MQLYDKIIKRDITILAAAIIKKKRLSCTIYKIYKISYYWVGKKVIADFIDR